MCRSRRELSNAYLLAKVGFDTAENEPRKVCSSAVVLAAVSLAHRYYRSFERRRPAGIGGGGNADLLHELNTLRVAAEQLDNFVRRLFADNSTSGRC